VDRKYLDLLPQPIKLMVAQIEGAIKAHIIVRLRRMGDPAIASIDHLPTLDCYMNMGKMFVTIILSNDSPQAHMLAHEVIHAWRYIVVGEPRLQIVIDAEKATFPHVLENDLAHIFVIPEELKYYPGALQYWDSLYADLIEPIAGVVSVQRRLGRPSTLFRSDLMRHWLILSSIPKSASLTRLRAVLDQANYLEDANALYEEVTEAGLDKGRMIGAALRHLGLSTDNYELARYDVPNRRCTTEPIPTA